jgi:ELWxxDGT repeat protein
VRYLATVLFLSLFSAALAVAAAPSLVVDLNPGVESFNPSNSPADFYQYTLVNGRVVFLALLQDPISRDVQCGLWATDGTEGMTERLADFCGEALSLNGSQLGTLATTGSVVFLRDVTGHLWRTDGTAAGTFPLAGVQVQGFFPLASDKPAIGPDGRTLFFGGCTPARGCEPWRSDGTREGTRLLRDIQPGASGSFPSLFTVQGGRVLFAAASTSGELWATDGTAQGTVRLAQAPSQIVQILPHGSSIYFNEFNNAGSNLWVLDSGGKPRRLRVFPSHWRSSGLGLHEIGGRVLLTQYDSESGESTLLRTDGTRGGTVPLGPPYSFARLDKLYGLGSRVLFAASRSGNPAGETDLWFLDPAMKAPRRLLGCPGGCPRLAPSTPLVPLQGRLLFAGRDAAHGRELWATDGTPQGTRLVKDLCPGPCDGAPAGFRPTLGRVLFEDAKQDLWSTDGTADGTVRLAHLPYAVSSLGLPVDLAPLDGRIVFSRLDASGVRPWISDLAPGRAEPLLESGGDLAADGAIQDLTPLDGRVLFAGCDGTSTGAWASDGTAPGTVLLPGTEKPCNPFAFLRMTQVGSQAGSLGFFDWDQKLWRTDGTPGGTFALDAPLSVHLRSGAALDGKLLFFAEPESFSPSTNGWVWTLWTSDGTPAGTQARFPRRFGNVPSPLNETGNGYLLFTAPRPEDPFYVDLWRTDGTDAGTRPILTQTGHYTLGMETASLGGRTFFVLQRPIAGREAPELWSTDGTAAGTAPVISDFDQRDLDAPHPLNPISLVVFKSALYFFAETGDARQPKGLWRSDGTAAGTVPVKTLGLTRYDSFFSPPLLTVVGDQLFFRADDGVHGSELWKTDGTPEGTLLVKDIAPGIRGSRIGSLTSGEGKLYFAATDGEHGLELWRSDGTAAGTVLVDDLRPGPISSSPEQLVVAGDELFFTADDGVHGRELWKLPLPR